MSYTGVLGFLSFNTVCSKLLWVQPTEQLGSPWLVLQEPETLRVNPTWRKLRRDQNAGRDNSWAVLFHSFFTRGKSATATCACA